MSMHLKKLSVSKGFSLIEVAVVMVIIGVILGALVMPLSTQRDIKYRTATEDTLEEIQQALLGFAARYGRLPCPATNASNGVASPNNATTNCNEEHGFVPARTLGISGSYDNNGRLTDAWANPILYSLSSVSSWAYANQIVLSIAAPDYRICSQSGCGGTSILAEQVVAVLISQGKDGAVASASPDQQENTDDDDDFVTRSIAEGTNTEFDDILVWISPNILIYDLIKSGQIN